MGAALSAEPELAASYARAEHMIGRRVADEFVLVPLARSGADLDAIYNLSRVGAFIWNRLDGSADGREVVEAVVAEFDVERGEAERDYLAFVGQLLSIGALTRGTI